MGEAERFWARIAWEFIKQVRANEIKKAGALGVDIFKVANEIREGYESEKKRRAKERARNSGTPSSLHVRSKRS